MHTFFHSYPFLWGTALELYNCIEKVKVPRTTYQQKKGEEEKEKIIFPRSPVKDLEKKHSSLFVYVDQNLLMLSKEISTISFMLIKIWCMHLLFQVLNWKPRLVENSLPFLDFFLRDDSLCNSGYREMWKTSMKGLLSLVRRITPSSFAYICAKNGNALTDKVTDSNKVSVIYCCFNSWWFCICRWMN